MDERAAAEQTLNEARNDVQRFGLAHADMRIAVGELDRYWHDQFLSMRDTSYAHTDEYDASGRRIRRPDESEPRGIYSEEWLGWEPGDDVEVEQLLDRQRVMLAVRAEAAQTSLASATARVEELGGLSD
jgi:hypothetical protein